MSRPALIDATDRQEVHQVWVDVLQAGAVPDHARHDRDRDQDHVDQRARGDAPEGGAGAGRRLHEGHPAQRPEHDPVGLPADLPTGQGVAELVEQDDRKEAQILQDVPGRSTRTG